MVLILLLRSVVGQIPFSLLGKSFCLLYTCSIVLTRPEENPEWKFHFVIRVYCRSLCSRPSFSSGSPSSLPPPLQKERELCTDCNSWWKEGRGRGGKKREKIRRSEGEGNGEKNRREEMEKGDRAGATSQGCQVLSWPSFWPLNHIICLNCVSVSPGNYSQFAYEMSTPITRKCEWSGPLIHYVLSAQNREFKI